MRGGIRYAKGSEGTQVRVTVDMFSGQPNPSWVINKMTCKVLEMLSFMEVSRES